MELFHEIYGKYYQMVGSILELSPLSKKEMQSLLSREGFLESGTALMPKLLSWPLFKECGGRYQSTLLHAPFRPMTALEKRWLKAVLLDPRARLFLDEADARSIAAELKDVEPLYKPSTFHYFDRFTDGDPYADEGYIRRFRLLLDAVYQKSAVQIAYQNQRGERFQGCYVPLKLQYSMRDDKFRALCARIESGTRLDFAVLNLARVIDAIPSKEAYEGPMDLEGFYENARVREPVRIEIQPERNAIERVMIELSIYEKRSEYDPKTGVCTAEIYYPAYDETELLIRLLSFGPALKVLGPPRFRSLVRERVMRQTALLCNLG
ncbi:WYL domain-containing protein [Christensenellaceae bacterium OttesenSCG-928-M15]|nr:WYL domain-containing protein [Christensenellaceae bacterium OttesenSCG-928-M15]